MILFIAHSIYIRTCAFTVLLKKLTGNISLARKTLSRIEATTNKPTSSKVSKHFEFKKCVMPFNLF